MGHRRYLCVSSELQEVCLHPVDVVSAALRFWLFSISCIHSVLLLCFWLSQFRDLDERSGSEIAVPVLRFFGFSRILKGVNVAPRGVNAPPLGVSVAPLVSPDGYPPMGLVCIA